jgi:hypothetical protein
MAGKQIDHGNTAIDNPAARATELKRAMIAVFVVDTKRSLMVG